ncbi:MAG: hypothetical protein KGQ41_07400 [Alphaproteobacteria bacterium]|nr:hypothetical protein [Alphaproteobacteria bacterium]
MTTTAAPSLTGAQPNLPMQVKYTTLLWILATAPIGGLIVLLDQYVLGGAVQRAMDIPIDQILGITAILTFPHIIASLIGFADPEYARFYKKPLIKGILISAGIAIACKIFIDGPVILLIVAFYSIYHNIMQQFGITAMMLRRKQTLLYGIMKWMLVIPSALAFAVVMLSFIPEITEFKGPFMDIVGLCLGIATILAVIYYLQIRKDPDLPKIGVQYYLGNIIWMYVSYFMIAGGYGLMAIIVSRIIHDFTAYWIYMVHDQNRNGAINRNPIYALPIKLGIKPLYLLVPTAIIISSIMLGIYSAHLNTMAVVISAFNIMHYYIEGHTWKRGTLHRQYVPFV